MDSKQIVLIVAIVVSGGLKWYLHLMGVSPEISWTASITLLTAILWVTEAIPIPATSLFPFAAFPLTGVLTHREAASALGSHVIILLMGAFMLSRAIEKSGVHRRFALFMLKVTGGKSAARLVLAFMLTSALLSMWISNTATTLMLLPIALAILTTIEHPRLSTALLLGIAYSASLGGVGTPIGTPPNIIFMSVYQESQGVELSFVDWMKTGIPIVLVAIPIMALWLTRGLGTLSGVHIAASGSWRSAEVRVLSVFALVAIGWITRPYWSEALDMTSVGDSTIALLGVVLMFAIPSGQKDSDGKPQNLLDWKTANDIPWGLLLLFAGGICIAKAFTSSGLSQQMGELLKFLEGVPVPVIILFICLFVTFLTEITSNTATATLLMPILALSGMSMGIDPQLLMVPAAISASCAFMLPVATAPNAIVYGTETFSIKTMAREGFVLNILVAFVVAGISYLTL